jgi:Tfp pilus assembly protein PilN
MKAVNLLPREAQRSFGTLRGLGAGTTALFGVLALACVMVVAYVVLSNSLATKRTELTRVQALQAVTDKQVAKLKPYADLEQARTALLERVRTLAGSRYDWPTTLSRIARALPSDALLSDLNGAAAGQAGATPTIALTGCTPSHNAVAGLIDRLRAVKGVASVSLQSSTLAGKSGGGAGPGCPRTEQFKLTVQLEGANPAAATATAGQPATPAPTTTPNAAPAGGTQ